MNIKQIKLLIVGLAFFASNAINAQNQRNKWLIGVGSHAVDHSSVDSAFKILQIKNWSIVPPLSKLTLGYSISDSLAIDLEASAGEIKNYRWNFKGQFFINSGLGIRFYPCDKSNWFDPYLRFGINYERFNYSGKIFNPPRKNAYVIRRKNFFVTNSGLGFNLWIVENFGINLESNYNFVLEGKSNYLDFFQHSASLVFRFADIKEYTDDYSLSLEEPKPLVIEESKPLVIEESKPAVIEESKPAVIEESKPPVIEESKPPVIEESKPPVIEESKPPVIEEYEPAIIEEPRPGIVEEPRPGIIRSHKKIDKKNIHFKKVFFNLNKATICPKSNKSLDLAVGFINKEEMANKTFCIYGYTDATGKSAYNYRLSQKRANSVKNALIQKGVDSSRLKAKGLGSENPIACNNTREGKEKNRRVEIEVCLKECRSPKKIFVKRCTSKKNKVKFSIKKKPL